MQPSFTALIFPNSFSRAHAGKRSHSPPIGSTAQTNFTPLKRRLPTVRGSLYVEKNFAAAAKSSSYIQYRWGAVAYWITALLTTAAASAHEDLTRALLRNRVNSRERLGELWSFRCCCCSCTVERKKLFSVSLAQYCCLELRSRP